MYRNIFAICCHVYYICDNNIFIMWKTETTKKSKATKEQIWSIWTDVRNWNSWDTDVANSRLFGQFEHGTVGELKSKNGPNSKFEIIECTKNKSFTNRSKLPLCTLDFIHEIVEHEEYILITHRIEIKGFLSLLFSRIIGKSQEKNLPNSVAALIKFAENE